MRNQLNLIGERMNLYCIWYWVYNMFIYVSKNHRYELGIWGWIWRVEQMSYKVGTYDEYINIIGEYNFFQKYGCIWNEFECIRNKEM